MKRKFGKRMRNPRCPYCKEPMELTDDEVIPKTEPQASPYRRIRRYSCFGGEFGGHHAYLQLNTLDKETIRKNNADIHIPSPIVDAIYGDKN